MDTEVTGFGHTTLRATLQGVRLTVVIGGGGLQDHTIFVTLFESLIEMLEKAEKAERAAQATQR